MKGRAIGASLAVFGILCLALAGGLSQMRSALAQTEGIRVASRERIVAGRSEGEVIVGDQAVIRIRTAAGGMTAAQRANLVAQRLQSLLQGQQFTAQDFRVARVGRQWAVLAGDAIVITADSFQASLNGTTPQRLAAIWRDNLVEAVTTQVAGFRGTQERTSSKIVPIVSLGSGIRVGAAQIAGPAANVAEASVVGQVEASFQDVARIRIFVPLRSVTNIQRVPQVNVRAYGDIQL